jgi:hypothetical protein
MLEFTTHLLGLCGESSHINLLHVFVVTALIYATYITVSTFNQFKHLDNK